MLKLHLTHKQTDKKTCRALSSQILTRPKLVISNNCLGPGAPVYKIFVPLRYFPIAVTDGGGILSRENSTLISAAASSIHLGLERIFVKEDEN